MMAFHSGVTVLIVIAAGVSAAVADNDFGIVYANVAAAQQLDTKTCSSLDGNISTWMDLMYPNGTFSDIDYSDQSEW
jgi:hypothetical protein